MFSSNLIKKAVHPATATPQKALVSLFELLLMKPSPPVTPPAPLPPSPVSRPAAGAAAPFAVRVDQLSLFYGAKQALFDVSLDVPERRVTAFIGPSGCGKSTLLRCFNRMNDLVDGVRTRGQVLLGGQEIIAGVKNKVQLDEVVEKSLRRAALWDEAKDRLHDSALGLSGGQQQRLCIARTIAVEPEVILMDEPCSALDPIATAKIEELIQSLRQQFTIVIVTHNMQQAARCSDKTAFFYLGKLIEFADTGDIFTRPANPQTEAYVSGRFG